MADSRSSGSSEGHKDTNKMPLKRTTDSDIGSSSIVKTMKQDDPPDEPSTKPNLSGIKSSLHGISYQIKLCIFVCLANAKKALDPTGRFSFKVVAEDPSAGKFDDIVYYFTDGDQKGSLKIQAKHKICTSEQKSIPQISLNDFMTDRDGNNPFALQKYFASFYDQQLQTSDMEGLIICTNSNIEEKAKYIWQTVKPVVTDSSHPSLDSYISSLFAKVGGKCYQIDYDKLMNGSLDELYGLFRQCTKRTRLAKLLVHAIKSKEKITRGNFLFKEYRLAILDIIDKQSVSPSGSYGFTKEFLDLSSPNSTPGYEAFRKEFKEQYQQELSNSSSSKDSSWLENLKLKQVFVAKDFFCSKKTELPSTVSFPDDKTDNGKLQTFCERFRLVCDTKSEHEVDELIIDLWRDLYSHDEFEEADRRKGSIEASVAVQTFFKTNFDWLMNPFAKPLFSKDIKKDLENLTNTLAHIKLKGVSDKLLKKVAVSPFRINPTALKDSELYEHVENEKVLEVEAYDIQFGATLLTDLLAIHGKNLHNTLLLDESDFINNSNNAKEILRSSEQPIYLIVVCIESFKAVHSIVRRWKKDILNESTKQVFLIKKITTTSSDLSRFCIRDVTEDSWTQFLHENIALCTTTISPVRLFQYNFQEHSIEEVIKQLDLGKHMGKENEIVKRYQVIENTYVQRYWIVQTIELKAENIVVSERNKLWRVIRSMLMEEIISYTEITEQILKHSKFDRIFTQAKNAEDNHEPMVEDKAKKVLILMAEAGLGKSTNLTWLAWHLRKQNPSSWVVRVNLSDHCTDFKPFIHSSKNDVKTIIDQNEGIRMLFRLVHLSLVEIINADLQSVRWNIRKCSECLFFSNGQAMLNEELMNQHGLSLNNTIELLVFIDKFNAKEFVLLMDGFDEIAPHYKEVVLMFLSLFAQFDGVSRLYLTSRPYSFQKQFDEAFKESVRFQLKPLTLQDKATMLYKIMRLKIHNDNNNTHVSDFYKALCVLLIASLADMSDIPLNLMMSMDILMRYADRYINFASKTVDRKLFEVTEDMSKPSFIVENFVETKIQLIYSKFGAKPTAVDNPILIDEHAKKLSKAKRQHGLVALWVFFDKSELNLILSNTEMRKALDYLHEINEAREKTGIISGIQDEAPMFIHRTFAEYLAACWIVERQMKGERQGRIKISSLESFWNQNGLRKLIDVILAKNHPNHLAFIEVDGKTVDNLFSTNSNAFNAKDDGNRTPLHLLACNTSNFSRKLYKCIKCSSKAIEPEIINQKERIFGWTALDSAFYVNFLVLRGITDHSSFIFYLLHNGGSINVEILYEQVVLPFQVKVSQAAVYAKYVMQYLSRLGISYESHDATRSMKIFCDKVAAHLINETMADFERLLDPPDIKAYENNEHTVKQKSVFKKIIEEDSVWMLESVIHILADQEHANSTIKNSFFDFALKERKVCVLKYFFENNPIMITEEIFRKCIAISVVGDYKNEFKFFIDLYCCQTNIKDFQTCSIQTEGHLNVLFQQFYDVEKDILKIFHMNDLIIDNLKEGIYKILAAVDIDKNILSVLMICVVLSRPIMLRYVKQASSFQLSVGFVYYLARATDYYIIEMQKNRKYQPTVFQKYAKSETKLNRLKSAFECLLDEATGINAVEVNALLRHAIISDLFSFSKCLIEHYDVFCREIDDLNGWIFLQLCVSRPRSENKYIITSSLQLFRCIADRTDMDCFEILEKDGRSILHLAIENGHNNIVNFIVIRKLGLNQLSDIESLGIDAMPKLTLCCSAIHEVTKYVGENGCYHKTLCMLSKQMAKLSVNIHQESIQQLRIECMFFREDAEKLYEIAIKCSSLSLIYYLYREFQCTFPTSIRDTNWLLWVGKSLNSLDIRLFKWIVRQYCVAHHINHPTVENNNAHTAYPGFEEFGVDKYDLKSVNLEELVKQTEEKLSVNKSKEEVCILKLLVLTVSLGHEPATRYLYETFNISIDQKIQYVIIEIAHHVSVIPRCGPNFASIYKYLFKRIRNLDGNSKSTNMLHVHVAYAGESGANCLVRWLLKRKMINNAIINEEKEWSILHYYASRKPEMDYCDISQQTLFGNILEEVVKNDELMIDGTVQSRENIRIQESCFNSNEGRKSVVHVAFEAGTIKTVEYIIRLRLGINNFDDHKIRNQDECLSFRECYDVVDQLAATLPFNAESDKLLGNLARPIDNFSLRHIKQTTNQENVADSVTEDACRAAIKYRSVSTLEHLIMTCNHPMKQVLTKCSGRELLACMMECIRRNKSNLFRVLVAHYRNLQGIQPSAVVEYEKEENDGNIEGTIEEYSIQWSVVDQVSQEEPTKSEYLLLIILSFAYGRLSMTKSLIEMLQLDVSKQLIMLLMRATHITWDWEHRLSVYEYLSTISKGKYNLLHLCAQSWNKGMVWYLTKHRLIDPKEIDPENGWNAGHYCVSEPISNANLTKEIQVFYYLMKDTNLDCFGVRDLNGRSVIHLALENGHAGAVEFIIKQTLAICRKTEIRQAWEIKKIDKCIDELQQLKQLLPDNKILVDVLEQLKERRSFLTSFAQAFLSFPLHTN